MDRDIKYITENFIDSNMVCEISQISHQELEKLITDKLIPNSSYEINMTYKINSPLGDEKVISEAKKYFPKSVLNLIQENTKRSSSEFKEVLKTEFMEAFIQNANNQFAYDGILKKNGSVDMEKLTIAFEQEWQYYLQGIYGICTINGTGTEIAKKEIAVKRLMAFNKKHGENKLVDKDKEMLRILNDEFNEVSSLFAPYQRISSSRGKYLDKILKLNALSGWIKNYAND